MIRNIFFRPQAVDDLRAIWSFTQTRWGIDQADLYVRSLHADVAKLSETPGLGSDRNEVRTGLRKLTSERHAIYYFHDETTIRISRVLHGSMRIDPKMMG